MEDNQLDHNITAAIEGEPEIIYEGEPGYQPLTEEGTGEPVEASAEDPEEELDEEEEPKGKARKPRVPAKTRINDLSRKYHTESRRAEKAEIELAKIREENERLKRLNESQNKSVVNSQESMIASSIMHARQLKAKAIEDGDIEAQVNADEALAVAIADKRQLDAVKVHQKLMEEDRQYQEQLEKQRPQNQRTSEYEDEVEATPEAVEWVATNPWFNESSEDYDPDLHQKAFAYAQYLDRDYLRKGKEDSIGTYEYFDDLNRYMSRHLQPVVPKNFNQGGLVMNRPKGTVAGVSRGAPQSGQRERFMMSKDEQDMARAHGWTDQQWYNNKKLAETLEKSNRLTTRSR